jgi:hypothetical protein
MQITENKQYRKGKQPRIVMIRSERGKTHAGNESVFIHIPCPKLGRRRSTASSNDNSAGNNPARIVGTHDGQLPPLSFHHTILAIPQNTFL